jgi:ADP-heptose:LPS heptosyltransferase
MSLPYILKIDKITPNTENYIIQNPDKTNYWKSKLDPLKKLRVGFVYNGLLASFIEKFIPLIEFVKLNKLEIDLICLCKQNEIKNDLAEIKNVCVNIDNVHFYDIDNDATLFQDTIAIMQNIDLLITIDTAIVHLAGVMGIKTWLLLGYGSDWRWMSDSQVNNWYKTVELIRMTENIELKHIMPKVKTKLSKLLATKNKM